MMSRETQSWLVFCLTYGTGVLCGWIFKTIWHDFETAEMQRRLKRQAEIRDEQARAAYKRYTADVCRRN